MVKRRSTIVSPPSTKESLRVGQRRIFERTKKLCATITVSVLTNSVILIPYIKTFENITFERGSKWKHTLKIDGKKLGHSERSLQKLLIWWDGKFVVLGLGTPIYPRWGSNETIRRDSGQKVMKNSLLIRIANYNPSRNLFRLITRFYWDHKVF